MKLIELLEKVDKIKKKKSAKEGEFLKELDNKKIELEKRSKESCNRTIRNAKNKGNSLIEAAREEAKKEAAKIRNKAKRQLGTLKPENHKIKKILTMLYRELGL